MTKFIKLLLSLFVTVVVLSLNTTNAFADYCGGSVSCCAEYETVYSPSGCSNTCNATSPGCVRCSDSSRECKSQAGSGACSGGGAGGGGPVCYNNCNGTVVSGGCTAYNPPAPVTVAPQPPPDPPPAGCEETNTCPTPPPEEEEFNDGYYCDPNVGCVSSPYGGDSLSACSAGCVLTPVCPGAPGCTEPSDPNAGASSCPDVADSSTRDTTYPGQTRYWNTWAPPPGADAATRLKNESPLEMIGKQFTSPGDAITLNYMWREVEGDFINFYVYDKLDETYYFYNGIDKPAVIFTRQPQVLANAVAAGYKEITWHTTADDSFNEAKTYDKRVYFFEDVDNNPWRTNDALNGYWAHADKLNKVGLVNCASLFNASGHKTYYSTYLYPLENDKLYCYRRQQLRNENGTPVYWSVTEDQENPKIAHASGNYLGLEQDIYEVRKDVPCYGPGAIFGSQDNCTKPIVPKNEILFGPRYSYFDNFMYAFMETKGQHQARPDQNNELFAPAFIRSAIMKIPTDVMWRSGLHEFSAFTGGIATDKCKLKDPGDYPHDASVVNYTEAAACSGFQVLDSDGAPTDELIAGKSYSVTTKANLESRIYEFYNSDINAGLTESNTSPVTADSWVPIGDISTVQSVRCDLNGSTCPAEPEATEKRVLKVQMPSYASGNTFLESAYAETDSSVTNKKFIVEFWARSDASTNTVVTPSLQRDPYTKTKVPFDREPKPEDTQQLTYTLYNGTPTTLITVTSNWQKFSGTVIFPSTHSLNSDTTRVRLLVKAPQNGGVIYYDNFKIIGSEKPTVNFNLVHAEAPTAQNTTANQCTQSTLLPLPSTNSLGETIGNFTVDTTANGGSPPNFTLGDRPPGQYYLFAHMLDSSGKHYIGNPGANDVCPAAADTDVWDDDIAATCMREVTIVSCNENTPPIPTWSVSSLSHSGAEAYTGVPGSTSDTSTFVPQTGITMMEMTNSVSPVSSKLQLAVSIPPERAADVTAIKYEVFKMDHTGARSTSITTGTVPSDGTQNTFNITITPTVSYTNQIYIEVYAKNENSCADEFGLYSGLRVGKIIMLNTAAGYVFDVPKSDVGNFNCEENYTQAIADGAQSMTLGSVQANGEGDSPSIDPYLNFYGSPYVTFGSNSLTLRLPHNPGNLASWKNRIGSLALTIPAITSQDDYQCLPCNQNPNTLNSCLFPATASWAGFSTNGTFGQTNFFVTKGNFIFVNSWWQSRGGQVASVGKIDSFIPILGGQLSTNCEPGNEVCQPYMSAKAMFTTTPGPQNNTLHVSAGMPYTNSENIDTNNSTSQNNQQGKATNANTVTIEEDYDYFYQMFDNVTVYDPGTSDFVQQLNNANYTSDGETINVIKSAGNLTIANTIESKVQAAAGEKKIIFVDGDLTIDGTLNAKITSVSAGDPTAVPPVPGGFLMFIVSGDIFINSSVGYYGDSKINNVSAVLEGVFLANDDIIVLSKGVTNGKGPSDNKFVAEGSFIALNQVGLEGDEGKQGIDLRREYKDESDALQVEKNSFSPTEMFIFRPDLIMNAPEVIKKPNLTWKEAN